MGRMNQSTFKTLFEYGKKVYLGEIDLGTAASKASTQNPEVAISSARHYITWYAKMRTGDYLTWNSNSDLLLYYAKRIAEEEGLDAGRLAIQSAKQFAQHVARQELEEDLDSLSSELGVLMSDNSWWPSLDEYNPMISKEMWLSLLNNPDVLGNNIRRMLAAMYSQGGATTCARLAELYGNTPNHYIMTVVHAAEKVAKKTCCPLITDKDGSKLWPIFFVGRNEPKTDRFIWKIRNELHAALTVYGIDKLSAQRSWLLAWNPNMWNWEDLSEASAQTRNGNLYRTTWACTSSGVTPGDRVYIITLGTNNNGIMASGYATSTQYEYEHWDSDKRAAGQMNKGVDISLDHVIDIGCQHPLTQVFLKNQFPDQHWSPQGSGISIKDYYVDELEKAWIAFCDTNKDGETEMTIKEKVDAIKAYIAARGFNYEGDLIENFYLSLKSKPFVILAGTSGTGKTRLVKLFSEAIGARMKLVPVRPDWSDSSDLFGHTDLSGNFHPGAIIDFIKQAEWNKDTPHFLCLDEMNLARVEYYLSDFLSIIETRDRKANGAIETDALIDASYFQAQAAKEKYGRVYLPDNLYIIGTVNMDETTFPFSKKVLDRANTIEFSFVNLMSRPTAGAAATPLKLDNTFLKTDYLYLLDCDDDTLVDSVCFDLEELNQILVRANLHVGYRVRDEISFYMMNNKKADLLSKEAAFDHEIMQKILPRIQGSSSSIKEVLSELFIKCAGDYSGFAGAAAYEQMHSYLDSKSCKYPNSAKKIAFMMRRYEEDGFTSYWL